VQEENVSFGCRTRDAMPSTVAMVPGLNINGIASSTLT
jgi:hypothetical protein